ncbi:MAG TPA: glycosyl transferase family 1 [Cyanobacteria bacterium UBA8803]|nr:glycosyl transferase family 1 [Cyanobacteria bacterium UBA8803]
MRILSVHNRYQIRGGEDESREAEERLLRDMGHQVEVYEENNDRVATLGTIQLASRTVWSAQTYRTIKTVLTEQTYDVVHVQNFFPLISPSVYYAAKAQGVPVVQTLRNYRLLCPNAQFFRDGRVCEDCLGKFVPLPGVVHACYRGNRAATGVVATMLTAHRAMGTWTNLVDIYIALTDFARDKFIQGGLPAQKIVVKPNFVHPEPEIGYGRGGDALFVGRLSPEKGIDTLLQAWERLDNQIPLKLVGDGPLVPQVTEAVGRGFGVEWLGRRPVAEVYELMKDAAFLVFPSQWYEGQPRTIIESFAVGTPVIASNLGAMSSLVKPYHNGLHFYPGNWEDLVEQVEWALAHQEEVTRMRHAARAEFEINYTAQENYRQLMGIYEKAIENSR